MQRIVIDTNVIVSALIGSSYPTQIVFDLVFHKKVIVCLSNNVLFEYVGVLYRQRFLKYSEFVTKAEIVLNKIDELASIKIDVITDTGNKNHFNFPEYQNVRIVTPEEFFNKWFTQT